MDTIIFSSEDLLRLDKAQLKVLAQYYGIDLKGRETRNKLIQIINDFLDEYRVKTVIIASGGNIDDLGNRLLPDETLEEPKYSVRARRAIWSQKKE